MAILLRIGLVREDMMLRPHSARTEGDRLPGAIDLRSSTGDVYNLALTVALPLYADGQLKSRDPHHAARRVEAGLRALIADVVIRRSLGWRSLSGRHSVVHFCQPRVMEDRGKTTITIESASIVMGVTGFEIIEGILPGGASPHLFDRVAVRKGPRLSVTNTMLGLSLLWPTLVNMRERQRHEGRGTPQNAIVTPFGDGLLFGEITKIEGLPRLGMIVTTVNAGQRRQRALHDWYAEEATGDRLWVETKTFVGAADLKTSQVELWESLEAFARAYADVVEEGDWRWRVGFGQPDEAVEAVTKSFRLRAIDAGRRIEALDALEEIVTSDSWENEAARNRSNQKRKRKR